jgi:hypothetical protein
MKHLKLFETFNSSASGSGGIELSREMRDLFMKKLEEFIILPQIYHENVELWADIMDGLSYDEVDGEIPFSKAQYLRYVREAKSLWGTPRAAYQSFMGAVNGIGSDSDWSDVENYSVEDYMREFGQTREIAEMMKSVFDSELVVDISRYFQRISI